jgi:rRNA maturation protein Nop10
MNRQSRKARFGAGRFAGKITMLAAGAAALALLGGCSETTTSNQEQGGPYTLTVNSTLTGGDTAGFKPAMFQITPKQAEYESGTTVTVIFNSQGDGRFVFKGWTGASTSENDTVKITMNKNQELTAEIERRYTITTTVDPVGSGTVSRRPDSAYYNKNTKVSIWADTVPGSKFLSWDVDTVLADNVQFSYTVNKDLTFKAKFSRMYSLTVIVLPDTSAGSVTRDDDQPYYEAGKVINLTAEEKEDYIFMRWEKPLGTTKSRDVTLPFTVGTVNDTLYAVFE